MKRVETTLTKQDNRTSALWLMFIGVLLIGANSRSPLTSVGSLIDLIQADLAMSHTVAGMITTLPLLAFAFISPFVPRISQRFGMERTIFMSLIVLLIGLIVRSLFGLSFLFIGTLLIGVAIAFGNVLLPGIIKLNFPFRVGIVMGFYGVTMNLFGAFGSGLSVPLSTLGNLGWRGALMVFALPVILTLVVWLPQVKKPAKKVTRASDASKEKVNLWGSPLAWAITLFLGLQSLIFYTLIAWLPTIFQQHGYTTSAAGWMLFLMQFALIPVTFVMPMIAERMKSQRFIAGLTGLFFIVGLSFILTGQQTLMTLAVIMIGMANGSAYSLALMFFSLRTSDAYEASDLSGMAQSVGYLLAALGPFAFGALSDLTNGWTVPLLMLITLACVLFGAAIIAGGDRVIADEQVT